MYQVRTIAVCCLLIVLFVACHLCVSRPNLHVLVDLVAHMCSNIVQAINFS